MFDNKVILVTGGTGSWGHELVRQLLMNHNPREIRIYSRGEHKQVSMKAEFSEFSNLKFIIGDVRDKNILGFAMNNVDYVFHLAALKHVPVCEDNTWEAVLTNIYGTQNVIECALANQVEKVVDISTDKAVDPFNHYGVTKACAEKMIVNASFNYTGKTRFVCIRGGNVIGTNGSVIPLFKKQILEKNRITITDPAMTRFLMNTKSAIELVFEAVKRSFGGEIFVIRMPATSVENIAKAMIQLFGNNCTQMECIGARPGEKLDEVLVSKNESSSTVVLDEKHYVILPQKMGIIPADAYKGLERMMTSEFTSRNSLQLSIDELKKLLQGEPWLMQDG